MNIIKNEKCILKIFLHGHNKMLNRRNWVNYRYIRIFDMLNRNLSALQIQRWWKKIRLKLKIKKEKNIVILR
jgi:hypothetical protein